MKDSATSSDLLKNSLWYAAAASVAVLPAQSADAQVVYTDVDPDVTVTDGAFDIDFDGNGTPELSISENSTRDQITIRTDPTTAEFVDGVIGNGFPFGSATYAYVLPLSDGAPISDSEDDFILLSDFAIEAQATFTYAGLDPNGWGKAGEAFAGVRFNLSDGAHFGWIRVEISGPGVIRVVDYAYESQPNTPIIAGATGVASDPDALESGYLFSEVSPNPVAGRSTFQLAVGQAETVTAELFDALGRRVQTLFTGALTPGTPQTVAVTASELPAGVYVVRVTGDSFVTTRNVTVVR